jgi:integrase
VSIERVETNGQIKYRGVVRHKGRKSHTKWVGTLAEAKLAEAALLTEMGGTPLASGHTVAEIVSGYISDCTTRGKSPATVSFYRKGEALIPEVFAKRDVSEVKPLHVDALYRELRTAGKTEHQIRKVHSILSASFGKAVKYGWASANPVASADRPQAQAAEIVPPTPEQVRAVITASLDVNIDLAVCLRLAAATGMRRAELVALKWRDVNGQSLTIRRSLVEDDEDGMLHVGDTKTGSRGHRTIRIGQDTAEALQAVQERQEKLCADAGLPVPEWVFTHDLETPWTPAYVTRAFARLATGFTLHGLRHFHATQLLAAGVAVANVSHRLGHSSPAVTLAIYSHWIPANDQESADIIEGLL